MICIVCGNKKISIKYKLSNRTIYQCLVCKLEILVNKQLFQYDTGYYNKDYFKYDFGDVDFYKQITKSLNLGQNSTILDV